MGIICEKNAIVEKWHPPTTFPLLEIKMDKTCLMYRLFHDYHVTMHKIKKKTTSQKSLVYNLWNTIKKMVQIVLVWITSLWWNVEHWLIANNYKRLCHLLYLVELSAYPLWSTVLGELRKFRNIWTDGKDTEFSVNVTLSRD